MKPRTIALAALATSRHNEPALITEDAAAFTELIDSALYGYVVEGARINPGYFRTRATVTIASSSWVRPATVLVVERLQMVTGGAEVIELPLDQLHLEPSKPAVYSYGRTWYPAGRANDPTGNLYVYGAAAAPAITTVIFLADTETDPLIPDRIANALLKWEIAIFLATRDGDRDDEVAAFRGQLQREQERFRAFLEVEKVNETRGYGYGRHYPSPTPTPR